MRNLLTALLMLAAAPLGAAEKISLGAISEYLNTFTTAEAGFTQINADGSISTGRVFLHRPGRARFEYDPPERALVLADGGGVAIFDGKTGQPPDQFPLRQTPLWIVLEAEVDLAGSKMVIAHVADDVSTTITAIDPEHPDIGNIQLRFTGSPIELRQWIVTDEAGSQTTVILREMVQGKPIPNAKFSIQVALQQLKQQR